MIPKRIVFTHVSPFLLTEMQATCYRRAKELHPAWEIEFYSDRDCEEFVAQCFGDLLELYQWYPRSIQRTDLFRILKILRNGGFYLDLDVYLHDCLDELCGHQAVFPLEWQMTEEIFLLRHKREPESERELWQIGNFAFGAEASHPFLEALVEEMIHRTQFLDPSWVSDGDVLYTTGPDLVSSVFYQDHSGFSDKVTLLKGGHDPPEPVHAGHSDPRWYQFGRFGNHLLGGSWRLGKS